MSRGFFVFLLWSLRILSWATIFYCIYILYKFGAVSEVLPILAPAVGMAGITSHETWLKKIVESIINAIDKSRGK